MKSKFIESKCFEQDVYQRPHQSPHDSVNICIYSFAEMKLKNKGVTVDVGPIPGQAVDL